MSKKFEIMYKDDVGWVKKIDESTYLEEYSLRTEFIQDKYFDAFHKAKHGVYMGSTCYKAIADFSNFRRVLSAERIEDLSLMWGPFYGSLGIKYCAVIQSKSQISQLSLEIAMTEVKLPFEINFFDSLESAIEWISKK